MSARSRRTYRKAAKAVCGPCRDGWGVIRGDRDKPVFWYHPTDTRFGGAQPCFAAPIHELAFKDRSK